MFVVQSFGRIHINKPRKFLNPSLCKAFEDIINSLYCETNYFDTDCIMYYGPTGQCYFSYSKIFKHVLYVNHLLFGQLENNFDIAREEKNILISKYLPSKLGLTIEWIDLID